MVYNTLKKFLYVTCIAHSVFLSAAADFQDIQSLVTSTFSQTQTQAQSQKEQAYTLYGTAVATLVKTAATLSPEKRNALLDLMCTKLIDAFQLTNIQASTHDASDKEVGRVFSEFMPDYQKAVATVISLTLKQFRANRPLQKSIALALCSYLKKMFENQALVSSFFNQTTSGSWQSSLTGYAQSAYTILMTHIQNQAPLQRGLIVNALCDELEQKTQTSAIPSSAVQKDAVEEAIETFFMQAQSLQDYAQATKKVITQLNTQTEAYGRYVAITTLRKILLWFITPAPVKAGELQTPESSCKWYEVDCWIEQLHTITTQAVWKPFGEFLQASGKTLALKTQEIGDSIKSGLNDLNNWTGNNFKSNQTTRAFDYGIRKAALEAALKVATGVLDAAQAVAQGSLSVSQTTAQETLRASESFLDQVQNASKTILQGSADVANFAVQGTQKTTVAVLEGGKIITQNITQLFDIKEIKYSGSLQEVGNGVLGNVGCKFSLLNTDLEMKTNIDLNKGVQGLTDAFMPLVKTITAKLEKTILEPFENKTQELQQAAAIAQRFTQPATLAQQLQEIQTASQKALSASEQLETQNNLATMQVADILETARAKSLAELQKQP